jgi:glycosyltransferase involved in cell wall biosynthesis
MVPELKMAFLHDNFAQHGGAERVAEEIAKMLPHADMLSTVTVSRKLSAYVRSRQVKTTWMQHLPAIDRLYRHYFLLYPLAVRSLDLSAYDVVISSCVGFAKGAIREQGAVHICYCHTPTRWIWRFNDYAEREGFTIFKHLLLKSLLTVVRRVDMYTASQPDYYLANSRNVANRIKRYYKRNAFVIYPPVDLSRFRVSNAVEDYLLIVSRLLPYKRVDLAIEACNQMGKRLVIIGDGPDRVRLGGLAGPTVQLRFCFPARKTSVWFRSRRMLRGARSLHWQQVGRLKQLWTVSPEFFIRNRQLARSWKQSSDAERYSGTAENCAITRDSSTFRYFERDSSNFLMMS